MLLSLKWSDIRVQIDKNNQTLIFVKFQCGYSDPGTQDILTLPGTGQGTFICMSLLDLILSAELFSKISKLF